MGQREAVSLPAVVYCIQHKACVCSSCVTKGQESQSLDHMDVQQDASGLGQGQ